MSVRMTLMRWTEKGLRRVLRAMSLMRRLTLRKLPTTVHVKARDSADRTNHVACGSPRVMFATIVLQYRTLQKFRISGDEFEELSLRRKN